MKIVRYFLSFCQKISWETIEIKKRKHNLVKINDCILKKYYIIKCNKNSYQIFNGSTLYHWMLIARKTCI